MATMGAAISVDPGSALLEEVHRTAGHVAWLGQQVAEMQGLQGPAAKSLLDLYQREREHLVRTSKMTLDAGVAERELRFVQQQGQLIAHVLVAALQALDLNETQMQRARVIVSSRMRELTGVA